MWTKCSLVHQTLQDFKQFSMCSPTAGSIQTSMTLCFTPSQLKQLILLQFWKKPSCTFITHMVSIHKITHCHSRLLSNNKRGCLSTAERHFAYIFTFSMSMWNKDIKREWMTVVIFSACGHVILCHCNEWVCHMYCKSMFLKNVL